MSGRTIDFDNPPEEAKLYLEMYNRVNSELKSAMRIIERQAQVIVEKNSRIISLETGLNEVIACILKLRDKQK